MARGTTEPFFFQVIRLRASRAHRPLSEKGHRNLRVTTSCSVLSVCKSKTVLWSPYCFPEPVWPPTREDQKHLISRASPQPKVLSWLIVGFLSCTNNFLHVSQSVFCHRCFLMSPAPVNGTPSLHVVTTPFSEPCPTAKNVFVYYLCTFFAHSPVFCLSNVTNPECILKVV